MQPLTIDIWVEVEFPQDGTGNGWHIMTLKIAFNLVLKKFGSICQTWNLLSKIYIATITFKKIFLSTLSPFQNVEKAYWTFRLPYLHKSILFKPMWTKFHFSKKKKGYAKKKINLWLFYDTFSNLYLKDLHWL